MARPLRIEFENALYHVTSRGMRQLNGVYTQKLNRRHNRVGHLYQGRYKAILVEKESYLLELARYVVLNPVREGIVTDPQDWAWSSYRATMGLEKAPDFLATEDLKGGIFLGKEGFVERLEPYMEKKYFDKEIPKIQRLVTRPKLEEIFNEEKLKGIKDRDDRIYQAVNDYGYTLKEVSNFLGLHYSTVSKAYTRAGKDDKFKT